MHLLAAFTVTKTFLHWLRTLGGLGLILVGLVDNSAIPVPGSMDVFTILLSAAHKDLWWYYALMATVGSLLGGYLTYRLGMKGGKELLEKRISARRARKVYGIFARYGFWSVRWGPCRRRRCRSFPSCLLPEYALFRAKFLGALALGRGIRYSLLAYLGSIYGRQILHWFGRYYLPFCTS